MDSNPTLSGSANGDFGASCSVHFLPAIPRLTIAIPDGLPNSATYTPAPFPVWLINPRPPRYDQFADKPLILPEVHPRKDFLWSCQKISR